MPSKAPSIFAWTGAALFALSLGYFLYTYIVTFSETSSGADTSTWRAVAWNTSLFGLFAAHHSVFARTPVRTWMATHVSPRLERSIYVWAASLLLIGVCVLWTPLPGVAWTMTGAWRWVVRVPLLAGIWLSLRSAGVIDIWDLAGVRQLRTPNAHRPTPKRGTKAETAGAGEEDWELGVGGWELEVGSWESTRAEFKTSGPYGLVRHPIYLGWILVVFSVPTMTMTRLAFAGISCLYLILAIPLEERTLRATAGAAYDRYTQRVRWRLIPGVKEKVLGAHRAGIKHIVLPKDNEADIEDIPEDVRQQLVFHCMETLDEVFEIALLPSPQPEAASEKTLMEEMEEATAGRP